MNLDNFVKIVQIAFFLVTGIIAILTYHRAKKTVLSTVNVEYQKRVMDRLETLSRNLYEEFDDSSPEHWTKKDPVRTAIVKINDTFERNKSEVIALKEWIFGTPIPEDLHRLQGMLGSIESDPFIPKDIRLLVSNFLKSRLTHMGEIYHNTFEEYADELAKGNRQPATDLDSLNVIHNSVVHKLQRKGVGITDIEDGIHDIRRAIQQYFEAFDPR
jgi:hypothetical protein